MILHEIGHALGIGHEEMISDSDVMHANYIGRKPDLSWRDIEAVLKRIPPRIGQFLFHQLEGELVPLGDYVYFFEPMKGRQKFEKAGIFPSPRCHPVRVFPGFCTNFK